MSGQLFLVSDAAATCGVEAFARLNASRSGAATHALGAPGLGAALRKSDGLIINLPVVAWKRQLGGPVLAAAEARLMQRRVTLVLHEWADLAQARRLSYAPLIPLADRILFSSPEVMGQFDRSPLARLATPDRAVLPVPPNFAVPEWTQETLLSQSLAASRAAGTLLLGQFGSIYPRKDPKLLLETTAALLARGVEVRAVFVGSFIKGADDVEGAFSRSVAALGLDGRVVVSGYVDSAEELYGLFAEIDVFVYPLSEGLTSRRASVLAAALSGRPVVVTAPERPDSLAHHRLFRSLVASGVLRLVPRSADAETFADAVLAARTAGPGRLVEASAIDAIWDDAVALLSSPLPQARDTRATHFSKARNG